MPHMVGIILSSIGILFCSCLITQWIVLNHDKFIISSSLKRDLIYYISMLCVNISALLMYSKTWQYSLAGIILSSIGLILTFVYAIYWVKSKQDKDDPPTKLELGFCILLFLLHTSGILIHSFDLYLRLGVK